MSAPDPGPWGETGPTRVLPDGRMLVLEPTVWGGWRMHVVYRYSDDEWSSASREMFTYDDRALGAAAFMAWDGVDEPIGWVRHQPSDRRRTNGDPRTEYVAP